MTSIYDLARQVNLRLNGDDESKFPILLTVIGELQYCFLGRISKPIFEGEFDDTIILMVELYNGSELDVMIKHQEHSHSIRLERQRRLLRLVLRTLGGMLCKGVILGYFFLKFTNVLKSVIR